MLDMGIIQPSTSSASPTVLVEKKDGDVRFCVDYQKLNWVSKFEAYPMPRWPNVSLVGIRWSTSVPQYASILAPLTELLKKGKPEHVHWTAQCEEAFQILKHRCGNRSCSFSDKNGHEHPIAFASRKLKPWEQKYAVIEK